MFGCGKRLTNGFEVGKANCVLRVSYVVGKRGKVDVIRLKRGKITEIGRFDF